MIMCNSFRNYIVLNLEFEVIVIYFGAVCILEYRFKTYSKLSNLVSGFFISFCGVTDSNNGVNVSRSNSFIFDVCDSEMNCAVVLEY